MPSPRCSATSSGRHARSLQLTFRSGSELLVEVDADVESWAVAGPDGFLIVCLARGELAVWGAAAAT
jgi:hypothetical protein